MPRLCEENLEKRENLDTQERENLEGENLDTHGAKENLQGESGHPRVQSSTEGATDMTEPRTGKSGPVSIPQALVRRI